MLDTLIATIIYGTIAYIILGICAYLVFPPRNTSLNTQQKIDIIDSPDVLAAHALPFQEMSLRQLRKAAKAANVRQKYDGKDLTKAQLVTALAYNDYLDNF